MALCMLLMLVIVGFVCALYKDGMFQRDFKTNSNPTFIAATGDNHLLITS